jgi:hypothetical protein
VGGRQGCDDGVGRKFRQQARRLYPWESARVFSASVPVQHSIGKHHFHEFAKTLAPDQTSLERRKLRNGLDMADTLALSSSGETAIEKTIDIQADQTADDLPPDAFDEYYEILRTAEEIERGDYKRVRFNIGFPTQWSCRLRSST